MKKMIAAALLLLALAFILPLFAKQPQLRAQEPTVSSSPPTESSKEANDKTQNLGLTYNSLQSDPLADISVNVNLLHGGEITQLNLYEYLLGVVSAEMPVTFEHEALKAQAVAARSYTLYRMHEQRAGTHEQADVCSDVNCCKAYFSPNELRARWGEDYEKNLSLIAAAVSETDGQCLAYENKAIFAAFHSSSSGYTEDSGNVFAQDLPYLKSVFSPEDEQIVPNYETELSLTFTDFRATVCENYPAAVFSPDPETWISDIERSSGGRILSLRVGGVKLTGTQFRFLFSLRSTAIEINRSSEGFVFNVTGYGHGVGMSQYGAQTLAKSGSDYKEILNLYYSGAQLCDMRDIYPNESQ